MAPAPPNSRRKLRPGGADAAETSGAATAETPDVAAAEAAMTTAEAATTGIRCGGHERNREQYHRGNGDADLQPRPHASEVS